MIGNIWLYIIFFQISPRNTFPRTHNRRPVPKNMVSKRKLEHSGFAFWIDTIYPGVTLPTILLAQFFVESAIDSSARIWFAIRSQNRFCANAEIWRITSQVGAWPRTIGFAYASLLREQTTRACNQIDRNDFMKLNVAARLVSRTPSIDKHSETQ